MEDLLTLVAAVFDPRDCPDTIHSRSCMHLVEAVALLLADSSIRGLFDWVQQQFQRSKTMCPRLPLLKPSRFLPA